MGFSIAASQCLVAPPYVAAAIVMFAMAWAGDKYHIRSPFILLNAVMAIIGMLPQVLEIKTNSSRSPTSRILKECRCTILRCLPCHHCRQRQRSLHLDMASQQYPWSMETSSLLCHSCRNWWYWWYHRQCRIQIAGCSKLSTWYLLHHDCCCFDHCDHFGSGFQILEG